MFSGAGAPQTGTQGIVQPKSFALGESTIAASEHDAVLDPELAAWRDRFRVDLLALGAGRNSRLKEIFNLDGRLAPIVCVQALNGERSRVRISRGRRYRGCHTRAQRWLVGQRPAMARNGGGSWRKMPAPVT